ncbi:TetR/AcrR family transcriptional regulator [Mycolicibacterium fortuitum]
MAGKQNPEQRRRELCDAAITLLAREGIKGVTHLKVDRKAGVPDGTTSFYFRTSAALMRATANRIADLDLADLTAATGPVHMVTYGVWPGWSSARERVRVWSGARPAMSW